MVDRLWKQCEREIARRLGGIRVPVNSTTNIKCDVSTPLLSAEIKERKQLPKFLTDTMRQSTVNCEKGKIATVILHEKGKGHDKDLVIRHRSCLSQAIPPAYTEFIGKYLIMELV
jgi:hypothetical protein